MVAQGDLGQFTAHKVQRKQAFSPRVNVVRLCLPHRFQHQMIVPYAADDNKLIFRPVLSKYRCFTGGKVPSFKAALCLTEQDLLVVPAGERLPLPIVPAQQRHFLASAGIPNGDRECRFRKDLLLLLHIRLQVAGGLVILFQQFLSIAETMQQARAKSCPAGKLLGQFRPLFGLAGFRVQQHRFPLHRQPYPIPFHRCAQGMKRDFSQATEQHLFVAAIRSAHIQRIGPILVPSAGEHPVPRQSHLAEVRRECRTVLILVGAAHRITQRCPGAGGIVGVAEKTIENSVVSLSVLRQQLPQVSTWRRSEGTLPVQQLLHGGPVGLGLAFAHRRSGYALSRLLPGTTRQ